MSEMHPRPKDGHTDGGRLMFESEMSAAQARAFRAGEGGGMDSGFMDLLRGEDDGLPHAVDYVAEEDEAAAAMKRAGAMAMMRYILGKARRANWESLKPEAHFSLERMLQAVMEVGLALRIKDVMALNYGEHAKMFQQTKAAVSYRLKMMSEQLEAAGVHGFKLPGQKKETAEYSKAQKRCQAGGANRNKGRKHPTSNTQH